MRFAKDHHPDQLIAKGMPAEFIDAATDKLARINRAYELMAAQLKSQSR